MFEEKRPLLGAILTILAIIGGVATVFSCVIALLAFVNPEQTKIIITSFSSSSTPTPVVIVATVPAPPPLPTYTPYPTHTPNPTATLYPKPTSSPTPEPILISLPFEDNFDMEPRPEWKPIRGTWRVVDGKYTADASKDWSMTFVGDVGWTDYAVDVDVFSRNRQWPVRIIVRAQDGSYMVLEATGGKTDWIIVSEGSSQ